ncbi:nuclear transport factor 2 family protein [Nonomuraea sp. B10E15]|uniref:nuclear transport factor 2 family protein n=1 Tax=unclassified Nonomuraea TaxID=2593643 RepID=UPI00325CF87A
MSHDDPRAGCVRSAGLASIAVDHAQLSYEYLDAGDVDAYASLFEKDVVLSRPGLTVRGRTELERFQEKRVGRCHHTVSTVIASTEHIAVVGSRTREPDEPGEGPLEFADVFTLSASGLFSAQQTFYFIAPG